MLKKYLYYLGVFILTLFSFYYTDRAVDIVKRNDPIMKDITDNEHNYTIKAVNALVDDDEIIPGLNGISVNTTKSYNKMKKENTYNPDMYVFEEVSPTISFINDYSKYIVSGNQLKQQVSVVFKIVDSTYISNLMNILIEKEILATLFVDGHVLEENMDLINEFSNNGFEIENLGYDELYSTDKLAWTNNLIASITNVNPKYCYTDYKAKEVLELCGNYHMHTIKPTVSITNYPFSTVKHYLSNGNIISFNLNNESIKELPAIISYIKQKGYDLVNLDELLSEDIDK